MMIRFSLPRLAAASALVLMLSQAPSAKAEWAGPYIGGSIGWTGSDLDWSWDIFQNVPPRETSHHSDRVAAGLHIGARRQWGQLVVGIEGSLTAFRHTVHKTETNSFQPGVDKDFESRLRWVGTITPRIGWDFGSWMAYVKGGYAVSPVTLATYVSPHGEAQTFSTDYQHGWTIGGGLEWRLREHVSLALEYDVVRLTGQIRNDVELGQTVASAHRLGDIEVHQIMLRLNLVVPNAFR